MVTFFKSRDGPLVGADRVSGDHQLTITALGAYLIDNADLGPLSETTARLKRWEFLLVVAPLPVPRAPLGPWRIRWRCSSAWEWHPIRRIAGFTPKWTVFGPHPREPTPATSGRCISLLKIQ